MALPCPYTHALLKVAGLTLHSTLPLHLPSSLPLITYIIGARSYVGVLECQPKASPHPVLSCPVGCQVLSPMKRIGGVAVSYSTETEYCTVLRWDRHLDRRDLPGRLFFKTSRCGRTLVLVWRRRQFIPHDHIARAYSEEYAA